MGAIVIPGMGETRRGRLSMPESARPRVFISYSHDSDAHKERVLELADRLRADGINAMIDQYVQGQSWLEWCEAQIDDADFVLMVCTETYLRRVKRNEEPGKGHGVLWEARLIKQQFYDAGSLSKKFVPVLLADGASNDVPNFVKGANIYRVETSDGYDSLLRLLTDQPLTPPREPGPRKVLPPRPRRFGDPGKEFVNADIQAAEAQRSEVGPVPELPTEEVRERFIGRRRLLEDLGDALRGLENRRAKTAPQGAAKVQA